MSQEADLPSAPPRIEASPRISILLCVYNGERFLAAAMASALAQTSTSFELVVIDDGSTDGSAGVIETFTNDPRVRTISGENRGSAAALASGLRIARGEFIAFLDQDDLWERDFLSALVEKLDGHPDLAMAFSWFRLIDSSGRGLGPVSQRYDGTLTFEALFVDFVIGGTSNLVVRRSALERAGGINTRMRRFYDLDLCLRVALLAPRNIGSVPRDLMCYRRHAGQMSKDLPSLIDEWDTIIAQYDRLVPERVAPLKARAKSNELRYFSRVAYEGKEFGRSLRLLTRGFMFAPRTFIGDRRNWLTGAAALSGALLPRAVHRALERLAGFRRGADDPR